MQNRLKEVEESQSVVWLWSLSSFRKKAVVETEYTCYYFVYGVTWEQGELLQLLVHSSFLETLHKWDVFSVTNCTGGLIASSVAWSAVCKDTKILPLCR